MTTPRLVDADARRRIETDGLHQTLFVEAGAGTGKTHELVTRVVNLVVSGGVRLASIAAITFTEAAAAELRDRIREAFEKTLASNAADQVVERCRQAIADLDRAAIGTLHAFCLRILTGHPLAIGLPPRVDVHDEVSSQLAFEDRWQTFVDELYDDPSAEELILRAWTLKIEIDAKSRMKTSMKDVARVFENNWDLLERAAGHALPPLSPIDVSPVRRALDDLQLMLATNIRPDGSLYPAMRHAASSAAEVVAETDPLRQLRLLTERWSSWKPGRGAKSSWEDLDAARDSVTALRDAAQRVVERATNEVLRNLSSRLAQFTYVSADQRRAEGRLDFHDLLVLAKRLLRTSAEARRELHDTYQRLLLDEFQDTDPIQIEVAVLIAAAVDDDGDSAGHGQGAARGGVVRGGAAGEWDELDPEDGRLFFVGDPKQSIYRFRRADIELFLKARDRFAGDGAVVLHQNFRTVEPVLDWVNHAFTKLMPAEVPGQQPAYHPLSADRKGKPGADHRVVLLGGYRQGVRAGELRVEEATAVARTVGTVASRPEEWPVFDRQTAAWREPRWSDVTILIPTRTSLRQLEDALDAARVPYRVGTGSLVFDTQEVREALSALRAIADPGDEIALVSALRSPLYACSDVDLFTFRSAGGRWNLYSQPPAIGDDHPVARALAHLRSLAERRWWDEPSALLDRLLRERNAFVLAFGSRRPREVWRRLRFIVDQARAFEEAGGGGVAKFLDWADLQRSEGTRVHEPLLAETDDDAVTILTIHGAKGLEFPITVVSGTTTAVNGGGRGVSVLWDGDVPEVRLKKGAATDNFDRLADIEAEMDIHERWRLLYVACTRAQDHLVVSTFHTDRASYGRTLAELSADVAGTLCRRIDLDADAPSNPEGEPVVSAGDVSTAVDDREGWIEARERLLAPQRRPRFLSATALAAEAADLVASEHIEDVELAADAADAADAAAAPATPWRRGRAGTAIGRAVHASLELLTPNAAPEEIVRHATRHAQLEAVPGAVDTIVALITSALASKSVKAAHAAPRMWRETYVAAPLGGRAVEGYVDLLFEGPDGLVLIDYKTDSVRNDAEADEKAARYALQIAAYAVAIETSTGLRVAAATLVFCRAGGAIERTIDDLDAAKDQVRQLLAA